MPENKQLVGVIPARWGSTRFPGKSLHPIAGKPLVQWVWERASLATSLSQVLIATDDERIVKAVEGFGGAAIMTREDHPSGTDRVAEVAAKVGGDAFVNIQGDEPAIAPGLIDSVSGLLLDGLDWDMATAATPFRSLESVRDPGSVKVVVGVNGQALYFSRAVIPYDRDETVQDPARFLRHIGIYGYQRSFLEKLVATPPSPLEQREKLEQLRALHIGCRMVVAITDEVGVGVDCPADVVKAEGALRQAGLV